MIDRAIAALQVIMRAVLAQQISNSHRGIRLSARVDVATMSTDKKSSIMKSMRAINELIAATLQL